jgi:Family of unknown function (DUF6057)
MTTSKPSGSPSSWTKIGPFMTPIVFFAAYFLFVLLYIDPRLVDVFNGVHKYSYILQWTKEYFTTIFSVPGGPDKCAATLVVVACRYSWLGAGLFTLIAWGLYATTAVFVKKCAGHIRFALQYVPPLLFLVMLSRYNLQYLPAVLACLGTILSALYFQRRAASSAARRSIAFCAFFALAYYLFSFNAVFFGVLVLVDEVLSRKKTMVSILCAATGTGVALWAGRFLWFPFDRVFNYGTILDFKRPLAYLFLVPVLSAVLSGIVAGHFSLRKTASGKLAGPSKTAVLFRVVRASAVLLVLAAVMVWAGRDLPTKTVRELGQVLYFDRTCRWTEILKKRSSFLFDVFPQYQSKTALITTHALYRALFHEGRLGSDMLCFPQTADPEPLLLRKTVWNIYFPAWAAALDVGIDLGAVSFAERIAGEAMENMGPQPFLVYRRALLQAAKGNDELALAYLNALNAMPGFRSRAESLLRCQSVGPGFAADTAIARLQACMDKGDYVFNRVDEETMLLNLLDANPRNKMAFEYLMAFYLLSRRPDKVANNLRRMDDFDYSSIPELYEEALVIYAHGAQGDSTATVTMPRLQVRPQTEQRCERFLKTLSLYSAGVAGAEATLRSDFGSSYFYFYTFGSSTGGRR